MLRTKKNLTLARLKNTNFSILYKKLLLEENVTEKEKIQLLSIAVILINHNDENLQRLGYRIALLYSVRTGDYKPLYELAINNGLMPIAFLINSIFDELDPNSFGRSSFYDTFVRGYIDTYRENSIVFTEQQFLLNKFFDQKPNKSLVIVAPTSYGKSELILKSLKESKNKKICIIVPTKALLAQTRKRILSENILWIKKIITHHEMYQENDEKFSIFVLTQERLQRLLSLNPNFSFDTVFIDEAHNLLGNDSRNRLLALTLCILEYRNRNIAFKFLTPFLIDSENLKLRYTQGKSESFKINEYVKSERFYLFDFREEHENRLFYDQFLDQFFTIYDEYETPISLITRTSTSKNIVYINSPKKLQAFAVDFANKLPPIKCPFLLEACEELAKNINGQYHLIDCLKKGVVYHHGSVPDTIRLYIEHLFNTSKELKFLVSSSTLLEGVNLPIETLYLLSDQKGNSQLTSSQFKNLIGRVSRFKDVFSIVSSTSVAKLTPKIYLIGSTGLVRSNSNLKNFIQKVANVKKSQKDDLKNELLCNTKITKKNEHDLVKATAQLENLEKGIVNNYTDKYVKTSIGKLLFAHNAQEDIDIFDKEINIQNKLNLFIEQLSGSSIQDTNTLIKIIVNLFISESVFVDEEKTNEQKKSISRLGQEKAQIFYAMLLDWKIERLSMSEMVQKIVHYWDNLPATDSNVFVGKWGDTALTNSHMLIYTDISKKTKKEKINLAILRVKEEEDFVENNLFKYIDILYEYNLLGDQFYKKIKYGTDDVEKIELIKNGFSLSLSDLMLSDRYREYLVIDMTSNSAHIKNSVIRKMKENEEGSFIIFEASLHAK